MKPCRVYLGVSVNTGNGPAASIYGFSINGHQSLSAGNGRPHTIQLLTKLRNNDQEGGKHRKTRHLHGHQQGNESQRPFVLDWRVAGEQPRHNKRENEYS